MRVKVNTDAGSGTTEEKDDAFHEDCIRFGSEKHIYFISYSSVCDVFVRCSVSSIEEL
jgi:hypothetical protein